jgi:hypothetical protein
MGQLAPPLTAIPDQSHEDTFAISNALLVAEPTERREGVELEVLTLYERAHSRGLRVAEYRPPLRLPER